MNTNSKLILILVIFIMFISGITCYKMVFGSKDKDNSGSLELMTLKEQYKQTLYNESYEIDNPEIYIGNDTANKFNLFDIVNGKCLVFRFSGETCNLCIDFVIDKLKKKFVNYAENTQILLIGSNINDRVKEKYYGKRVISFTEGGLGLPFEKYSSLCLFVIDKDRNCKMFFIPDKSYPEYTDIYLDEIVKRFLNQ